MPTRRSSPRNALPVLAVLAVFGGVTSAAHAAVPNAPPSVLVFDQAATGNTVSIDYANLPLDGYVVVYASDDKGNRTGQPMGYVAVKAGSHQDIKVQLQLQPATGTQLWASIYKDKDGKEGFDKAGDKSVWSQLPLQNSFTVQ